MKKRGILSFKRLRILFYLISTDKVSYNDYLHRFASITLENQVSAQT